MTRVYAFRRLLLAIVSSLILGSLSVPSAHATPTVDTSNFVVPSQFSAAASPSVATNSIELVYWYYSFSGNVYAHDVAINGTPLLDSEVQASKTYLQGGAAVVLLTSNRFGDLTQLTNLTISGALVDMGLISFSNAESELANVNLSLDLTSSPNQRDMMDPNNSNSLIAEVKMCSTVAQTITIQGYFVGNYIEPAQNSYTFAANDCQWVKWLSVETSYSSELLSTSLPTVAIVTDYIAPQGISATGLHAPSAYSSPNVTVGASNELNVYWNYTNSQPWSVLFAQDLTINGVAVLDSEIDLGGNYDFGFVSLRVTSTRFGDFTALPNIEVAGTIFDSRTMDLTVFAAPFIYADIERTDLSGDLHRHLVLRTDGASRVVSLQVQGTGAANRRLTFRSNSYGASATTTLTRTYDLASGNESFYIELFRMQSGGAARANDSTATFTYLGTQDLAAALMAEVDTTGLIVNSGVTASVLGRESDFIEIKLQYPFALTSQELGWLARDFKVNGVNVGSFHISEFSDTDSRLSLYAPDGTNWNDSSTLTVTGEAISPSFIDWSDIVDALAAQGMALEEEFTNGRIDQATDSNGTLSLSTCVRSTTQQGHKVSISNFGLGLQSLPGNVNDLEVGPDCVDLLLAKVPDDQISQLADTAPQISFTAIHQSQATMSGVLPAGFEFSSVAPVAGALLMYYNDDVNTTQFWGEIVNSTSTGRNLSIPWRLVGNDQIAIGNGTYQIYVPAYGSQQIWFEVPGNRQWGASYTLSYTSRVASGPKILSKVGKDKLVLPIGTSVRIGYDDVYYDADIRKSGVTLSLIAPYAQRSGAWVLTNLKLNGKSIPGVFVSSSERTESIGNATKVVGKIWLGEFAGNLTGDKTFKITGSIKRFKPTQYQAQTTVATALSNQNVAAGSPYNPTIWGFNYDAKTKTTSVLTYVCTSGNGSTSRYNISLASLKLSYVATTGKLKGKSVVVKSGLRNVIALNNGNCTNFVTFKIKGEDLRYGNKLVKITGQFNPI